MEILAGTARLVVVAVPMRVHVVVRPDNTGQSADDRRVLPRLERVRNPGGEVIAGVELLLPDVFRLLVEVAVEVVR